MKRLFAVLTMLLLFGLPAAAQAANVPVYLEGERLAAAALEQGGVTYLPLRTIFEALGAEVDWQPEGQRITARFANGMVLRMQVNSPEVETVWDSNVSGSVYIENPPFMRRSTVYIPLRFVAEELQYEVDWRNNSVYIDCPGLTYATYSLNLNNGELREKTAGLLGRVDLPSIGDPNSWYAPNSFIVSRTEAGNYLFQAEAIGSGALSFSYKVAAYLPAGNPQGSRTYVTHSIMDPLPEVLAQGGKLWFSDDEIGIICIDDAAGGQAVEYRAAELFADENARAFCYWTDNRFLLLNSGGSWQLYDLNNQTMLDLAAALVTAEVKAEAEAFMQARTENTITAEYFANFWQCLNYGLPTGDPTPGLWFEGAEGRELHFRLVFSYWGFDESGTMNIQRQERPLTYQLPE